MPLQEETAVAVERAPTAAGDDHAELMGDIQRLFVNPDAWLNTPHPELQGHRPVEFLQAGREQPLRDLVAGIKFGLFA